MAGFGVLVFLATFFGSVALAVVLGLTENQFYVLCGVSGVFMVRCLAKVGKRLAGVDHA